MTKHKLLTDECWAPCVSVLRDDAVPYYSRRQPAVRPDFLEDECSPAKQYPLSVASCYLIEINLQFGGEGSKASDPSSANESRSYQHSVRRSLRGYDRNTSSSSLLQKITRLFRIERIRVLPHHHFRCFIQIFKFRRPSAAQASLTTACLAEGPPCALRR